MKCRMLGLMLWLTLVSCGGSGAGSPGSLPQVPRNRTLILGINFMTDYDSFNPFILGIESPGFDYLFEPLYFYNAYVEQDNIIPWIATGHEFNDDYTEVKIHIRPGVTWSDGHPWTAHDLKFTVDMLRSHAPELAFSTDMDTWVKNVDVPDSLTAVIALKAPNPRFVFSYFTYNFGNGIHIVPKHIWEDQDPTLFKNLNLAQGFPVVSGPYRLALSEPLQRIWDVRHDWWAVTTGFQRTPKVERIIYLPQGNENKWVQLFINNEMDQCTDLRPANIKALLDANPNVTTWSGRESPYGYRDWWPPVLGFNNLEAPFDDAEIRWAVNHAIDREQLVEVGWQGAGEYTLLPFPDFPPLKKYTSQVQDLLAKYGVNEHNPGKTAQIMQRKGWALDEEGLWVRDGQRVKMPIVVFPGLFQDFTPVLVQQLRKAGFDASFRMYSDAYTNISLGRARAFIMGIGGSVRDPYFTLRLFHSRFVEPTGTPTPYYYRWSNAEFDRLVDQMGQVAPDDPALIPLFRQAMEIWIAEMPAIPLLQWFHRIPHNQTYWTNWPSAQNPYMNSANWVRTVLIVLLGLEPTQD
ncbi:MAG TPA: ABC transporter substrate-binding protein [Candidatus Handelsmanbacteria bacterium]|nr:ABC transporter substrate-binding protein [Candidatus Handelsmanbacteria bacterium]